MAPKVRRPAAAPARVRVARRPAGRVAEEEKGEDKPITEEYNALTSLTLDRLRTLDIVELGETSYYGAHAKVAGRIRSLNPGEEELSFELTGTMTECILERFGGSRSRTVKVHVCPAGCAQLTTGDDYFHSRGYWDCSVAPKPWHTNLIPAKGKEDLEVDELAGLRVLAMERGKGKGGDKPPREEEEEKVRRSKSPTGEPKKKDKKKRKKEREAEKEYDELLAKREETEELERGQKTARALFSHTCLDPNVPRRKRLMKRARRVSKKKEKKRKRSGSSGSGSSTSTTSEEKDDSEGEGPLFEETRRLRRLSEKCPGALTAQAIDNVREHLLSSRGELHSISREQLSPLFSMYAHQHLQGLASPVMWQELLTVAQVTDLLLRRKVATAMDVLVQRAKSLEATLRGGHYSVSRQLELVNAEQIRISEPAEQVEAAKSARDEFRNRSIGNRPHGLSQRGEGEAHPKGRGKPVPTSEPSYKQEGGEKGRGKDKGKWGKKAKDEQ